MTESEFVTHGELANLVQVLDRRMDGFEHRLNRLLYVLGTAQGIALVLLVLVLRKVGI
jgi:hypothetical protein